MWCQVPLLGLGLGLVRVSTLKRGRGKKVKSSCRQIPCGVTIPCDKLHSKMEERGGKVAIKAKNAFSLTNAFTRRKASDWSRKYWKAGEVRFVFSYRCKAPRMIGTQSERSTLVATNNSAYTPICWVGLRAHVFTNEATRIECLWYLYRRCNMVM